MLKRNHWFVWYTVVWFKCLFFIRYEMMQNSKFLNLSFFYIVFCLINTCLIWISHSLCLWPLSREKARLATDSELDQDLSDRLGLDSSDTLTNGSHRADVAAARRLAKRLFNLDGFRKSDVARHLSKKWAGRWLQWQWRFWCTTSSKHCLKRLMSVVH